ncbi:MAG: hypothetical protein A2788_01005 [Candidatus Abawacabacteria bacterium RIFCSPHIGHO2_01_FULL_46_8]|uniref:Helicase ATP-binding domain-containing protein n=1 Tax=Candidatus Abawacabacteria bacterium RIFCSPHIGHO2_01_FULL_46_8 TaxID=1817815 RepID=A0A1F4XJS6_9BACT|nr:MAG: hypothetical protein A2788_01005 [Candidatus Abawacabacteria bacterium RIFCSPHIGHO2_01_FULL_46_8]
MPTGITYTILDLETTGLKPERDRIIDFAAIKLVDGKEVARLSQLIKPGIPIPPLITVITGIKDEDVASAPKWADFKDQAADFIQDTIIVGHNIGFDLGFLRTHGIEIGSERALDTMDLASILLPKQESYALEILCKELKFACRSTHRALADVEATGELFQHLVEKLVQLPRAVLTKMESLCQRSTWAGSGIITAALAKAGKGTKGARKKTAGSVSCPSSAGSPRSGSIPAISANTIAELFAADSPLATILPKYQLQPGQNQLAQEVWQAVTEPANALIEVGAGIGKTLAYLAPSLLWALGNKSKVVVATKSWQQEEQLIKQDIPLLTQLLQTKFANAGQFKHAIIKSNFNYLCQLKWDAWQTKAKFSKEELIFALKLTDWLATSNTGDQNEIHLNPTEQGLWPKLAASEVAEGGCLDHPHCFLKQARANAKDADLLITNQALVVRDSLNPDHLIPPQAILIIDEAHQFEAVATQHYGNAVTLERTLANVVNTQERLHSISQQNQANLFGSAELVPKITQLDSILTNLHGKL